MLVVCSAVNCLDLEVFLFQSLLHHEFGLSFLSNTLFLHISLHTFVHRLWNHNPLVFVQIVERRVVHTALSAS